ncbi:MAG TPA: protein kinase [Casimicrobiaceae bacterium]|nr:protein kinase [Casimicrobiaceae bacterium]
MFIDKDRWQAVSPLLDRALDLSVDERNRWLAELREKNPSLAAEVETLLEHARTLEREAFLEHEACLTPPQVTLAGLRVGAYTLEAPLGHGGMGSVWLARRSDGRFEGKVAVKFLNAALVGRAGEQRFRREGDILARLTHPNIARLIDAGVSETGQPYLVLDFVEGERIDRYCDDRRLDVDARLRLFVDVLAAVAHAHAHLIVHRDIKPSNVLVTNDGMVKLLDFGIAKLLEDETRGGEASELTREAGRALTPEFAAPEHLLGDTVTTATDVYALGVLLYVLLGGQHPALGKVHSPPELIKAIVDVAAPRLSDAVTSTRTLSADTLTQIAARRDATPEKLRHVLRGDLDNIVAKAQKKHPRERYGSVTAFAADIERYLSHQPISARADSVGYRAAKFVRRNRLSVALSATAVIALLAGLAGTITQAARATNQAALAEQQRSRADLHARVATEQRDFALRQLSRAEAINDLNTFLLSDAAPSGRPFTAGELLGRAATIVERQHAESDAIRVEMLVAVGRQYSATDRDAEARRLLGRAYAMSRLLADHTPRARAACALAPAIGRDGDRVRAEALLDEGMADLPDEPRFAFDRINCLLDGSLVARDATDATRAIERAEAAEALLPKLAYPSTVLELRVDMDLAAAYDEANQFPAAVAMFERAHAQLVALGRENTEAAGGLYNNWGLTLHLMGQTLKAEELLRRSVRISSADGTDRNVSPMRFANLSRTLLDLEQNAEAARDADLAYARARALGDEIVVNQSLLMRSRAYRNLGDFARARRIVDEAASRSRRVGAAPILSAAVAYERAMLAHARGDTVAAMADADEAVAIAERGPDLVALATFLLRRAELELALKRLDRALADARRANPLFRGVAGPGTTSSYVGRCYLVEGIVLADAGQTAEAHSAFSSALENLRPTLGPLHAQTKLAERLFATSMASSGRK